MKKRLTYKEKKEIESKSRRQFMKKLTLGVIALGAGYGVVKMGSEILKPNYVNNWVKEQEEKLDKNAYLNLIDLVERSENQSAVPEQGWSYYAAEDLQNYPCLKERTSQGQLETFYKVFNNQKQPTLIDGIKRPIFKDCE